MNERNSKITQNGAGTSGWLSLGNTPKKDWSLMVENPGAATVTVEATLANVNFGDVPTADQSWPIQNVDGITTGGLFGPMGVVRAIRLVVAGAGLVTATVLKSE